MEKISHNIKLIVPVYKVISYTEQNFFSNTYLLIISVDENIISRINLIKVIQNDSLYHFEIFGKLNQK